MFRAAEAVEGTYAFSMMGLGLVTVSPRASPTTTTRVRHHHRPASRATGTTTTGASTTDHRHDDHRPPGPPPARRAATTPTATYGHHRAHRRRRRLPRYDDRLAWVGIAWGAGGPRHVVDAAATPTRYTVVVFDAETGHNVLAYTSRGASACGGTVQPPASAVPPSWCRCRGSPWARGARPCR